MRTVRFQVAYDGSAFFGWQRQDGFGSVQEALEEAFGELLGDTVTVIGAGRTDTGVHALGQVAHCQVETRLEDDRLRHAVNAHLPEAVVVRRLETCADEFHSRFHASGKRYLYLIATSRFRPPLLRDHVHWVHDPLDLAAMRAAAAEFRGRHDYKAFGNAGSPRKTTVRSVQGVRLLARRERLGILVQGEGFLYNMVRTMVGTLLDVGRGRSDASGIRAALASGERTAAGPTAPARGLYLARVLYPEPVFAGRDRGPHGVPGAFQY